MTSSTDEAIFQRLLDDPAVVGAFSMTVDGIVQLSHGDLANPAASQLAPSIRKLLQDVKGLLDQVPPVTNKAGVRAPDGFKRVSIDLRTSQYKVARVSNTIFVTKMRTE